MISDNINGHARLPACETCRARGIFYDGEVCGDCWGTGYDFTEVEQKAKAEGGAEERARTLAAVSEIMADDSIDGAWSLTVRFAESLGWKPEEEDEE